MNNELPWSEVESHLDKDRIYYVWTAKFQSKDDEYALVSQTRILTLAFMDGWELRLICGYSGAKKDDDRRMVRFGVDPLYRILDGTRKGYLRPIEAIADGEPACSVDGHITLLFPQDTISDVMVNLKKVDPSWCLAYGNLYSDFIHTGPVDPREEEPFIPEFFMSRRRIDMANLSDLSVSQDEETLAVFQNHPQYQINESLIHNCNMLKPLFGKAAPEHRIVFPWKHFYGRGVPIVSVEGFGQWHSVPSVSSYVKQVGVEINLGG